MFETRFVLRPTKFALETPPLQRDYWTCWQGLRKHFDGMTAARCEHFSSRSIDYAGLFPPAALSMEDAVRNYDALPARGIRVDARPLRRARGRGSPRCRSIFR